MWLLPRPGRSGFVPRLVLLDNASIHRGDAFKGRREERSAIEVHLFYLPPRSPELNRIDACGARSSTRTCPSAPTPAPPTNCSQPSTRP
ncbi:transposase [Streptomyces sp. NPDC059009]|uniref:transposase n=1 Tax=Streptomyces sp. NPDC059009 TaxID=3346694 RepID=UPI0036C2E206